MAQIGETYYFNLLLMRDSLNFCCPRLLHEATPVSSFGRELCFYQEEQLLFQCHLVFRLNVPITRRFTGCLFHDLQLFVTIFFSSTSCSLFPSRSTIMSFLFCRFSSLCPSWFRIPVAFHKKTKRKRMLPLFKARHVGHCFSFFFLVDRATFLSVVFK